VERLTDEPFLRDSRWVGSAAETCVREHRSMMDPMLRAVAASGQSWDDPSEDLMFELLSDIESGTEQFFIIERKADSSGETYAQVIESVGGGWRLERRDGSADRHFGVDLTDKREVHAALVAWAFALPGWETHVGWQRMSM
jgi:hypothetical protein